MATVETPEVVPGRARRIEVANDAEAALPQLNSDERRAVADLLAALSHGETSLHDLIAQRLRGEAPLFLLRVPGADAVRLFVCVGPDAIIVEDVARPTMLARVFGATRL